MSSIHVFFFNDTATTEIYTLSLHDALPIYDHRVGAGQGGAHDARPRGEPVALPRLLGAHHDQCGAVDDAAGVAGDRKSTRLNSSHANISYAVFCLKKKKMNFIQSHRSSVVF